MGQLPSKHGRWRRAACAALFSSGCVLAAALVITNGLPGALVGLPLLVLAWMAADRADPSKWPR